MSVVSPLDRPACSQCTIHSAVAFQVRYLVASLRSSFEEVVELEFVQAA
jgi:hypothetical protein